MDHTQATRKTIITGFTISQKKAGDPLYPMVAFQEMDGKDVWTMFIRMRSGLLPERTVMHHFYSQDEVDAFVARHPVGSELNPDVKWIGSEQRRQVMVRGQIDHKMAPGAGDAGDEESPLAFQVLDEAGLTSWRGGVSKQVVDFLGRQRVGSLKNRFGENWKVAAVYEYCALNLPNSSPAYIAALYQFHYYITMNDFAAGYLWRDLETIVHGVETAALQSLEMRKKAGVAGSEKSALARETRRSALMDEMEALTARNPDFAKLGVETVAKLALGTCTDKAPALWKQGRGQVAEYIGEIRRGEAGQEMKARYEKIFGAKPLRRLRP